MTGAGALPPADPGRLGALAAIVERKRAEADTLRCGRGGLWGKAETMPAARALDALRGGAVIAEIKRRSPSGGTLRPDLDPAALARDYARAGAAAISVLTDGPGFGGSPADLEAVRAAVDVPLLRKDFVVDPVQIAEARVLGADIVLLIAAVLGPRLLEEAVAAAARARLHALVEVHDEEEVGWALDAGASLIGVNNRDLRTLRTDLATFGRLRALLPAGLVVVAESGVRDEADAARLVAEGANAILVGETLLRSPDPGAACAGLVAAARRASQ